MRNVVLTRIDDRLIHGQVVTAWTKRTNTNAIVIVDDPLVKDMFMQRVLKAAAPAGIGVTVLNVKDGAAWLNEDGKAGENVMVLVKTPLTIEGLLNEGVDLKKVVLGGMGAKPGRKKFNKNISATDDEVACMKRIMDKNVEMVYQLVPDETAVDVHKLI